MTTVNFHACDAPLGFNVHSSFSYSEHLIIKEGLEDQHTYQMALLRDCWFRGMTVRIWYSDSTEACYKYEEFRWGMSAPSGKLLRAEHDLYRLWAAGGLGAHLTCGYNQEKHNE